MLSCFEDVMFSETEKRVNDPVEIPKLQATGEGEEELDKKGFYSLFAELQAVDKWVASWESRP